MSELCTLCPLCLAPPGHPHAEGCGADTSKPKAPAPSAEERAALMDAIRSRNLVDWMRGGRKP
jgi:hypothetical protein